MNQIECLNAQIKMQEWVVKHFDKYKHNIIAVWLARRDYCEKHNLKLRFHSFLCQYDCEHEGIDCDNCPAVLITGKKDWGCSAYEHLFSKDPSKMISILKQIARGK